MNSTSLQPIAQITQAAQASPAQPDSGFGGIFGFDSADILRGQKTVAINHNGSTYKLQATRLGKLILTK